MAPSNQESVMRKAIRYSARVLAAAVAIGAAWAAWPSVHIRAAFLRVPIFAWIDEAPVGPRAASRVDAGPPAAGEAFAASDPPSAHCRAGGCANGVAIKSSDACEPCVALAVPSLPDFFGPDLGEAPPAFAEASFNVDALGPGNDPSAVALADFEPVGTAAAAPEISTAVMLTLGLAAVVGKARRMRRSALNTSPQPRPC
jgi:hypothetical protein